VRAVALAGNLVLAGHDRFGSAQADGQRAVADALHCAGDQVALTLHEFVVQGVALGFADALQNNLFGGLCGDAPEGDAGLHRHHHRIAKLGIGHVLARHVQRHFGRIRLDRLDDFLFKVDVGLAGRVNLRLDALVVADVGIALVGGDERLREGVHHHFTRQRAQLDNLVESQGEIALHSSAWFCPTGTHAIQ